MVQSKKESKQEQVVDDDTLPQFSDVSQDDQQCYSLK